MEKKPKAKVVVVLPAYNAAETLKRTLDDIPKGIANEVILVDDASNDQTVELAEKYNLTVHQHLFNMGYGANQKSCYKLALDAGADIVVMLHPDYQYDARVIGYMVGYIKDNYFDVVLGSRIRSRREALDQGMPLYKYLSNRFLSIAENILSGQNLSEWHTGMRSYSREVLESIDFENNSNDFVFDSQVLFQIVEKGFRMGEIPVPVRYFEEASSINFQRSLKYGLGTLMIAIGYFFRSLLNRKKAARKWAR